jgi:hypothetical protein
MPAMIQRPAYAAMYGPTTGDRLRLGDTDLIIEVEEGFWAENTPALILNIPFGTIEFCEQTEHTGQDNTLKRPAIPWHHSKIRRGMHRAEVRSV